MSPEKIFLLKFAVPDTDTAGLSKALHTLRFDWEALYHLADRHGMTGIMAKRLLQISGELMPSEIRKRWTVHWRLLAMRDLAQMAALQEILPAAQAQGARPMLLKGLAVQLRAYPRDAARGASDIDLLVRLPEAPILARCLEAAGFKPLSNWPALLRRTNEATFSRASDWIHVDLHWTLCAPIEEFTAGLRLTNRLWEGPREIPLCGSVCVIPDREKELLFMCLHLLKAEPFILRNLSDFIRLLSISEPVDWPRFLELAQSTGTGALAYYALGLASTLSPHLVPDGIRTALTRFSGPRWLISPSLQIERLLETQGRERTNLSLRWRGVFFAQRPWVWAPYQVALTGKRLLRQFQAVLR